MTAIVCTAIVCLSGLSAWILWLRQYPPVTRKEWLDTVAALQEHQKEIGKIKAALSLFPARKTA